ncbi:unnamed protein product, partial [Rotaria sp. Silwood1]
CMSLLDMFNSNIKQGINTDFQSQESSRTTPSIALIHNDIQLTGQQQLIKNQNNVLTTELMSSHIDDHFDEFPLPPFTQFQKKNIPQKQNQDRPITAPSVHATAQFQNTCTQPPVCISSFELTPEQLFYLTQVHLSCTYDLRTHQQSQNKNDNLQLLDVPLSDTDDQQIDLFCGGGTTPQNAIHLQQASINNNDNGTLTDFRSKPYKDYLLDNSTSMISRCLTPHKF